MLRKLRRVAAVIAGLIVVVVGGLALGAEWWLGRSYAHVALPPIAADHSPAGVARGEMLFQSLCIECHGGPDGRATGKKLEEVPSFLGEFWSANLAHPQRGVHTRSDGEIARVVRNGVLPDGTLSVVMNGFGKLGDADIAALLGYMRSGAPAFAAGGPAQPRSRPSVLGAAIMTYVAKVTTDAPASGVLVPAKAPTAEYGRYMALAMDCAGCHTDGFAPDKHDEPGAFAGGFELTDPTGTPIFTRNITFDEATGIGRWSVDDLQRAVTRGERPDGYLVRKPMPLFSRLDRTDIEAIYAYLKTVPKVSRPNKPGGHALKKARRDDPADVLFVNVGCASCHDERGAYRAKLLGALDKSEAEVADWILNPQAIKPGSPMPSFSGALDRAAAERLARYVKELAKKQRG